MKKILIIIGFTLFFSSLAWGQITTYKAGEKFVYSIQYGIITGGNATLELTQETLNGKEVWHSKLTGKTTGVVDALFRVVDIYESYIDPTTELPVMSIRNIHEGRYKKYNVVWFDHKTRA
ncbi:MAG TPA: DUF3108 domain-containing protein, partial [Bacteroidales bacterium]|nr:DUF3108 domain-containing protein [Bacteroidales bacterium]